MKKPVQGRTDRKWPHSTGMVVPSNETEEHKGRVTGDAGQRRHMVWERALGPGLPGLANEQREHQLHLNF